MKSKKILVTGGAGYIGSVLVTLLLERGYEVTCLDRLFFGKEPLKDVIDDKNFKLIKDDLRWFDPAILRNIDTVMDLAALSNDPSGELDPEKTMAINHKGRVRVATLSKKHNIQRYILASSCSVYGFQDEVLDERSSTNPLTTYANANLQAEAGVLPMADDNFTVVVLRQATVYGLSPRMRFDLVINAMTKSSITNKKISVFGGGKQWRPLVHVEDVADAFAIAEQYHRKDMMGLIREINNLKTNRQRMEKEFEDFKKKVSVKFRFTDEDFK